MLARIQNGARTPGKVLSHEEDPVRTTNAVPMVTESKSTPVRVPKLAVRNRSSVSTAQTEASSESSQAASSNSSARPGVPGSPGRDRQASDASKERDRRPTNTHSQSGSSNGKQQGQQQAKKKKNGGMFGFLTLKEPSSSAWEEYAEQQKKASAAKGGRKTAVGMPGISSQKLPEHVPKVNSKWDGLPDEARKRAEQQKEKDQRQSKSSRLSGATWQSYRSNNSSSSDGTGSQRKPSSSISSGSQPRSGPSSLLRTSMQSAGPHDLSSSYEYGKPAPSATNPALRRDASNTGSQKVLHPPTLVPSPPSADSPILEMPELANSEAAVYMTTSEEPSPLTPPTDGVPDQTLRTTLSKEWAASPDSKGTPCYSAMNSEEATTKTSNLGVLADLSIIRTYASRSSLEPIPDTASINSRPDDWPLRSPQAKPSPSPLSASHQPQPSMSTDTAETKPPLSHVTPTQLPAKPAPNFSHRDGPDSTRPTTAAAAAASNTTMRGEKGSEFNSSSSNTNVAPSIVSAQSELPSMERLGLGGKVRRSEVLPWEQQDPPSISAEADNRSLTISKKKRFSAMLGMKE